MRCPSCNAYIPEGATHCLECGYDPNPQDLCQKCGAELHKGARFCNRCGAPVLAKKPSPAPPVKQSGKCIKCGGDLVEGQQYCPWCGTSQENENPEPVTGPLSAPSPTGIPEGHAQCPRCGTPPRGNARFCFECGHFLGGEIEEVICRSCGSTNALRYVRCQYCGAKLG